MKENKLIEKIQLLQLLHPDEKTVKIIKKKVYSQVFEKRQFVLKSIFDIIPAFSLAAFGVVIYLSILTGFLPQALHNAIIFGKIALASTQYERAKIAYEYVDNQVASLDQKSIDRDKISSLAQSLSTTNEQMSELKLMGEKGKYTSQQCLELYENYHGTLKEIEEKVTTVNNKSLNTQAKINFLTEVKKYEKQSELKLGKYKANE